MKNVLFICYHFFFVIFFLFLATVMLYRRLFGRFLKFALGFFLIYMLGAYVFFGRMEIPFLTTLVSFASLARCVLQSMRGCEDSAAWIGLGTLATAVLGPVALVAGALRQGRSLPEVLGALLGFTALIIVVLSLIEATVGYERLVRAVGPSCFVQ